MASLRLPNRPCGAALALSVFFAGSRPASASLGASEASIASDAATLGATHVVADGASYHVHELRTPSGIVIREYASAEGVFAVTWRGPWLPDLRQLLGTYFDEYASEVRTSRNRRKPVAVEHEALVVRIGGHMRSFFGVAFLPGSLPTGMDAKEIRP